MDGVLNRLLPAPKAGGFRMPGYWVWCGSAMRAEDGRYHLFAARWPQSLPFFAGYLACSEIVRAESATPEGPYVFQEVVLPARGAEYWDGRMTHNPTICRYGQEYLLFYIGSTYEGATPTAADLRGEHADSTFTKTYQPFTIGVARADSLRGPWRRMEQPVLRPRPGKWDCTVATNPAPCVMDDGRILLYYRSNTPQGLRIGLAAADAPDLPFERVCDEPVLRFAEGCHVEDPFVWHEAGRLHMLAKDMTGGLCGELHAGIYAQSEDGVHWRLPPKPKAYSRRVLWDDGSTTVQGCLERPQLLLEDGRPVCLFAATGDGPGGFHQCRNTWNLAIPLRSGCGH